MNTCNLLLVDRFLRTYEEDFQTDRRNHPSKHVKRELASYLGTEQSLQKRCYTISTERYLNKDLFIISLKQLDEKKVGKFI